MMDEKPETRTAVLKLKLGKSLTGPTKRLCADLHAAAQDYNVARNRMVRFWERWCEDNPQALADGKMLLPKGDKAAKVVGFSTQLYHAGREVSPRLASIILASASNTLLASHILKRTPWNHRGKAKRMWQAILGNEAARPCFRECSIAAPSKTTTLRYGDDHATLTFALFSKEAGRKHTQASCRIEIGKMPRGLKKIVRNVATGVGDWKLCDSEIVWKEGRRRGRGTWYFHMCYQRPPEKERLAAENVATLAVLDGKAKHPFEVSAGTSFPWGLGDVGVLKAKYDQLETRRLVMRDRYRDAGSGRRGHGRARIEYGIRPVTRQSHALMERVGKNIVAQAIKYCRRYDCGTLAYDAPGTRQKAASWFAANDIPFDWTTFAGRLAHRCWVYNIRLVASGEVVDEKPGTARGTEAVNGTKEAATGGRKAARQGGAKGSRSRKPPKNGGGSGQKR